MNSFEITLQYGINPEQAKRNAYALGKAFAQRGYPAYACPFTKNMSELINEWRIGYSHACSEERLDQDIEWD